MSSPAALGMRIRDELLVRADEERARATRDACIQYSETVAKLRERFEVDLGDALADYRVAVFPAHRACNREIIRLERQFARHDSSACATRRTVRTVV